MFKPKRNRRTMLRQAFALFFMTACLILSMPFAAANAQDSGRWFLLRNHTTGTCWPSVLITINGQYQHAFAQKAGGPYATEAQARARQKELAKDGTCQ